MKLPVFVAILFITLCSLKAQSPYSSMSREQLNLAQEKAKSKINLGITLTFTGVVAEIAGIAVYSKGLKELDESEFGTGEIWSGFGDASAGLIVMFGGLGLMGTGIPFWAVGVSKKKKIDLELIKFRSPGSASAYGVGFKIYF